MLKKLSCFLIVFSLSFNLLSAQDSEGKNKVKDDNNFSIGFLLGTHTQSLEKGNVHLSNLSSYNVGLAIDYKIANLFRFKTGFSGLSTVSIAG